MFAHLPKVQLISSIIHLRTSIMIDSDNKFNQLHIKRPCLLVADLQRSLTVYRDILGFKLVYQSEASSDSYLYSIFKLPDTAKLTFAAFDTKDEPRALALTEVKGIELPPPTPPYRTAIIIRVGDLASTIAQIRQLNLEIVKPNSFTTPPNLYFTEQAFYDDDGHLIMLYEVTTKD